MLYVNEIIYRHIYLDLLAPQLSHIEDQMIGKLNK